jgi:2-amino-4-hydroxy-6-hydroxymethyldihydropteridine diphosphokinase
MPAKLKLSSHAFIALGSNLGDSPKTVRQAMERLQEFSDGPVVKSSLWQTSPVGCPPNSPKFINAVLGLVPKKGETPESLLEKLHHLEKECGRVQKKILNEPRPLDLDLIAFGGETRDALDLVLPHPRAHLRKFVLLPLAEIAPDLVLAGQGKTVAQLLSGLASNEVIRKLV